MATAATNGNSNNGEYCKPEQEVSHIISDQLEETLQAERYPQPTTVETKQGVSSEPTRHTEVVPDMKERRNDDAVTVLIVTGDGPVNNDPIIEDNTEDKDANDASGTNIINHVKELEITKEDTGTTFKSDSNKAKVTRKSSFRITSIID